MAEQTETSDPTERRRFSRIRAKLKVAEAAARDEIENNAEAFMASLSADGLTPLRLTPEIEVALMAMVRTPNDSELLVAGHLLREKIRSLGERWIEKRADKLEDAMP